MPVSSPDVLYVDEAAQGIWTETVTVDGSLQD